MTIEIKFEKIDDPEGEYYVSLDGRSGELVGKGDNGRVKALNRVARDKMSKEVKRKWLDTLQAAEPKCTKTFSVEIDPAEEKLDLYDLAVPRYAGCALSLESEAPQSHSMRYPHYGRADDA